jgi:hypothetical protein
MTTSRRTLLCQCRNLWPLKTWLWPAPSLLAWYGSEFSWFPLMKSQFGRHRFQGVPKVLEHSLTVVQNIPKKFQMCFQQLLKRWTHCINRKRTILKGITTIKKSVYFAIDSVGELLDMPSYAFTLQCPLCLVRCYQSYSGSAMLRKFLQYKNSWNSFRRYSNWSRARNQVLRREANAPEKEGKQGFMYRTQSLLSYCADS